MKDKNKKGNKVKEELLLSMIFIVKWLLLAIGVLVIAYFSISFAYNKIYYQPLIKVHDIKIAELTEDKNNTQSSLQIIKLAVSNNKIIIDRINNTRIPEVEHNLEEANKKLRSLNVTFVEKYAPWKNTSDEYKIAYKEKDDALKDKELLTKRIKKLNNDNIDKAEKINELIKEINELDISIVIEEREKEKVGTGALSVYSWFALAIGVL